MKLTCHFRADYLSVHLSLFILSIFVFVVGWNEATGLTSSTFLLCSWRYYLAASVWKITFNGAVGLSPDTMRVSDGLELIVSH
jgi:hypothetical protein